MAAAPAVPTPRPDHPGAPHDRSREDPAPLKHPVDQVPPVPKLALYGLQHVMAFYAGAVLVPILVASGLGLSGDQLIHLINADLFTCGIASIIQSVGFWKVGVRLPLLQGVTFAGVAPMIAIGVAAGGGTDGLVLIYGSVIVAGLATFFVAPYFGKILRFFPPVVTGSVITIIGITLLQVAANDAIDTGTFDETGQRILDPTDPKLLAYSLGTLLLIVLIQRFFKGFIASIAVLIGLVVGTTVAFILGDAHFGDVAAQPWVGVTTPFYFGWPKFGLAAIISMLVVMLITAVETTGSVYATGEIVGKRIKKDDIPRALRADGLATTIGGVMNSFPYTCFSENVGLVRLTQVKSRWVIAAAGGIMIILGVLPKTAAIVAGIPHSVLGGAALALFATVAVVGIQSLAKVDFNDHRNMVIVSTSLGIAMFVTFAPGVQGALPDWASILFGSGITAGSFTAIVLNILFFHVGKSYGPAVAGSPGRRHPARSGQRDGRERIRRDLRRPGAGFAVGGRTGLRAAAVRRHVRPAGRVPGRAADREHPGAAGTDQVLPGPGQRGRDRAGQRAGPRHGRAEQPRRGRAGRGGARSQGNTSRSSASRSSSVRGRSTVTRRWSTSAGRGWPTRRPSSTRPH